MPRSSPAKTDDDRLIKLAAAGDRQSFGRLYERYSLRVFRHAYFLTRDLDLAEDLTAQTFLNALQAISRYESRGVPFIAWLLRITGNLAINHRKSPNNGCAPLPETLEAPALYSPEQCCEVALDGARVWQEVQKLPYEQRLVLVMRFMDDRRYEEIAKIVGKSVGAVRVIQFRALTSLRNLLRQDLNHHIAPRSRAS